MDFSHLFNEFEISLFKTIDDEGWVRSGDICKQDLGILSRFRIINFMISQIQNSLK